MSDDPILVALKRDFPGQFDVIRSGPECGDGWLEIIREVCAAAPAGTKWECIKEKFGGLRMYATFIEDEAAWQLLGQLVADAERKSDETCEWCGKPGRLFISPTWRYCTRCDACKPENYAEATNKGWRLPTNGTNP